MDDSQIVELYLSRDESAITQTSQKYGSKLRRIARNVLSDTETSEECENDAYLRTWNLIPPNEPRTYLFSFVGKIVRHLAIDRLRHEGRQKRSALYCELTDEIQECIPGRSDVSQEYDAKELSEWINSFLDSCSDEQRNIFVRRYWYFDSVTEICEKYSLPQSKVKTTLFRMREKLKKHLADGGFTA
ncbi:MAG: RNA polymerase sigma factor [Butyrivibrio sp.]|uniref:RNA polymerase sigma factor n=1 Tax=Butyrivibrio sp. TaxID=28121 RepID=UPI0025D355AE|nr:RNA polymerase sigma factor [Butyrivibrio sp.]MCR5771582.1 RNA polymerase sigma factor [Butyrivibrio sp.]